LLVFLALAVALFAAMMPLVLKWLSTASLLRGSTLPVQITINVLTFTLAALVGAQFPVANRVEPGTPGIAASRLYTADFVGASIGALLASAWLIPVLGVTMMCWLAAGLNLLGAVAVLLAHPKPA
jgi:predicted membrane-bound spermidine synthase